MTWQRPDLPTLKARKQSDIESRLPGTDPRLKTTVLNILAVAVSGAEHGLHGHVEHTAKQMLPNYASGVQLERLAFWYCNGMTRNKATAATDAVGFIGNDGGTVPAGRAMQRSDGVEFTTDEVVTIVGGVASVGVTASAKGQIGNTAAGTTLQFVTPVTDVNSEITVGAGGLTGGTDIETDVRLLARMEEYVRAGRNGINLAQYAVWAKEVPGVTRAWAFDGWLGAGSVGVFFVRDDDADLIPDAAEVQAVQDYIDERRPPGMSGFQAIAPTALPINMTIQLTPNTPEVQAAVIAELDDMFRRDAAVENNQGLGVIPISHLREAISTAEGEEDYVMSSPTTDIIPNSGELAVPGVVTWI